ncbi:CueP family metal-binding protein [Lentibacillus sp. CBA3610]|uniref:CueP family metal-binding protein n=1 Tax=Lentibacillus sp. CBA3610 TaxID=2518176 RepID=UPI001595A62C|nr:CueP family metal-binding protein [Lentibacillus sp. CBA3610]QKY69322.1 hypothetical protein Len3610_06640 [Lentibacillus sp. CBA3610]
MKKSIIGLIGLLLIFIVAACGEGTQNEKEAQNIKEMVEEYSTSESDDISASITSHELIVTDSESNETSYELPEDEFFVSIAPYANQTHPCSIHSLTGCQGELTTEEFEVNITNDEGKVIVDETMTSLQNGFIDLWLPRNETFQVKIEQNGKTAESEISTFEGDNTCITTMQLT